MPRVPYSYPAPGASSIADAIRQRRGERGLTPLDGMLLNAQPIAEGWNKLLGAVRTGSSLQDDLREIMILRVAARNRAAFEWIHHEPVARKAGVTTEQLTRIGDIQSNSFSSPGSGQLSPLQAAAAAYADAMTAHVKVQDGVFDTLKHELAKAAGGDEKTNQLMVEATGTVAVYNMVSRFLVALDIDDRANQEVPVPGLPSDNGAGVPTFPESNYGAGRGLVQVSGGQTIATRVHFHSMTAPWVILINSLMTNLTMWDDVVPGLSDAGYNVVCYDQRGHGASPAPSEPCTVEQLADDAADVLTALGVDKARAVIGVSQGGATALSFAIRHPDRAEKIVANDTQPASPAANAQAWEDRIALAKKEGMKPLADATVARWYGSDIPAGSEAIKAKASRLIEGTDVFGFEQGARALQKYDLLSTGLLKALAAKPTLLVAGEADGALPKVLEGLSQDLKKEGGSAEVTFASVSKAAHLPMMDNPQGWLEVVLPFLKR